MCGGGIARARALLTAYTHTRQADMRRANNRNTEPSVTIIQSSSLYSVPSPFSGATLTHITHSAHSKCDAPRRLRSAPYTYSSSSSRVSSPVELPLRNISCSQATTTTTTQRRHEYDDAAAVALLPQIGWWTHARAAMGSLFLLGEWDALYIYIYPHTKWYSRPCDIPLSHFAISKPKTNRYGLCLSAIMLYGAGECKADMRG